MIQTDIYKYGKQHPDPPTNMNGSDACDRKVYCYCIVKEGIWLNNHIMGEGFQLCFRVYIMSSILCF